VRTFGQWPKLKFSYDLWIVEVADGAARRLTKDGGFVRGIWLPAVHKIAALKDAGKKKGARLWLMDENGRNRQEVAHLKLPEASSAVQPWRDGREVVAVGRDESTGIWSVDATSGRATRLSDVEALWVAPLDAHQIVFAAPGNAYPPISRAASIGVLDADTGRVRWVLRDLQGMILGPHLVRNAPVLVFGLLLDGNTALWALRLRDGKLKRLANVEHFAPFAVAPGGTAIYYVGHSEKPGRSQWFGLDEAIWRLTPTIALVSW
jgi:hypothetical protein